MEVRRLIILFFLCILTAFTNFTIGQIPPVLSNIEGIALDYTEGEPPANVTSTIVVEDPDDDSLQSANIQITLGFVSIEDVLSFTPVGDISGLWVSGTLSLSGKDSKANYEIALRNVTYQNTSDDPSTSTRTVSFTVNDGDNTSDPLTRDIYVTAINSKPVLSAIEASPLSYTEGNPPITITSLIDLTDPDDDNMESADIQITSGYASTEDVLSFTPVGGISGGWTSATGTLSLSGSSSITNYITALRSVTYQNTSNDPSTSTRTVSFTVNDGDNTSDPLTRDINVTAINSKPVLSAIEASPLSYTEDDPPITITSLIDLTDPDDDNMESADIQITSGYASTEDVLSFTPVGGISGGWTSATGTLSLSGVDSKANYETALRSVTYQNTSENPSISTRTIAFTVNDGEDPSNSQSRDISITADNDPPVLSAIEASPLSYNEDDGPVTITSSITVTDVDNSNMSSAEIQITTNYNSSEDVLDFTSVGSISGVWNSVTGTLSLSGVDSKANYETALKSITYENTNTVNPSILTRTINFTVSDGVASSNSQSRDINVSAVNSPPVLSAIEASALSYNEGAGPVTITSSITVTDVDNINLSSAAIQITTNYNSSEDVLGFTPVGSISGGWNSVTGTLSLSGVDSKVNYETALRSITYENTNTVNPSTLTRTINFTVSDGTDNSNTQSRNINVIGVNSAPVLSAIEASPLSYNEGDGSVTITSSIIVTDVDDDDMVSAAIQITTNYNSSEDVLSFTPVGSISGGWTSATGTLSLSGVDSKANYETALRSVTYQNTSENPSISTRTIAFTVNDGEDPSNSQTRDITINAENDPPVLSAIEASALSYNEGDGSVTITSSIIVTDVDNTNLSSAAIQITTNYNSSEDVLSFTPVGSISGGWNSVTGTLSLSGVDSKANYETALRSVTYENTNTVNPSTLSRTITFTVNDGTANSNTQSRNINVTAVNSPPVLSAIEASPVGYTEGDAPVTITSSIAVTDVDNTNLSSAAIQITSNYNSSEDVLDFTAVGSISGLWDSGTGIHSLSGTDSKVNYETALRSVTYENTNTVNPSTLTRTITFIVNDGVAPSNSQSRDINVTAVNSPPVLSAIEASPVGYNEGDAPVTITSSIAVTDVDNTNLSSAAIQITSNYNSSEDVLDFGGVGSISGVWDSGTGILSLSGTDSKANYETALRNVTYENTNTVNPSTLTRTVTFTVNDGMASSNSQSRDINVSAVNSPPVLSAIEASPLTYNEGDSPVTITSSITVTDDDNSNLSSAAIQISTNYNSSEDVLDFTAVGSISGGWDSGTGILSLSGIDSKANYETALRSVTYENTNTINPSTLTRTITFTVNDGEDPSNTQTRNISITAENDPPVLSAIEASPVSFTEGGTPVNLTSVITVTDVDDDNMESATLQITSGYQSTEDVLSFTAVGGISGVWNSVTGILSLSGTSSKTNYTTALRSVTYQNTSEDPSTSTRTATFTVNDGDANSNIRTRIINITATNDAPVLSDIETTPLGYSEGEPPAIITTSIVVTDVDDDNMLSANIQITTNYNSSEDILSFTAVGGISGVWTSATGTLSLSGSSSKTNYITALRSVTYQNTSEDPSTSTRTVTFRIYDGKVNSNTQTRNISITAQNDPPELSGIETAALPYTEDQGPLDITNTLTVTDVDDDNIEYATVRITSGYLAAEDTLVFTNTPSITGSWNDITGMLTLTGPDTKANYQAALRNVSYINTNFANPSLLARTVTFTVNDGDANSNTILRSIVVTSVNDPPELSGIETAALPYTEDQGILNITNTLTVTDIDDDNIEYATVRITSGYLAAEDTLVFTNTPSITGSWNDITGTLTLTGPATKASFQSALRNVLYINTNSGNPSLTARTVTFRVHDGTVFSNPQTRNITITRQNDAPVLSGIETAPLSYSEGDGEVPITATILVRDPDDNNIESASIRILNNYINTEDTLIFTNTAYITSAWDQFTGTLTLTGTATKASYQTALRNVRYKNKNTLNIAAVQRTVTFVVSDGELTSNIQSRNINVTGVNDPPVVTNVNISGNLIINSNLTGLYGYDDPENDPEGNSIYIWYRSDFADGTDSVEISGADEKNYVTRMADGGNYLSFGVIPIDNMGAISPFIFNSDWEYINDGPVALNLHIAGVKAINQPDTADFVYYDLENNPENSSNHYYQWFRADNASGLNKVAIVGATHKTYTITNNDNLKYISVEVSLAATAGSLRGDTTQSIWYGPISYLPSAAITGTETICPYEEAEIIISYIGDNPPWSVTYTIDGDNSYTISDIDDDETSFLTSIPGVYELQSISDNRYTDVKISGSVTISLHEVPTIQLSGIVTEFCDDGFSVGVLEADFTGEAPWNITLDRTGVNYTIYTDITDDPFTINVLNEGTYNISALSDANCTGDPAGSGSVSVIQLGVPEAVIEGTETICPGNTAYLTVTLIDGLLPWQFTYTVNGLNPRTVTNIYELSYTLEVSEAGEYELESVEDPLCTGKTSGTGKVYYRSLPSATLTGGGDVCEGTSANLTVALNGTAPWNFKYKITDEPTIYSVNDVSESPHEFQVSDEGLYILTEVTDKYCTGTVSGSVNIEVIDVPPVRLLGLQQAYSVQDDPVPLSGDPPGGTFSGPGIVTGIDPILFIPGLAGITEEDDPPHKIIYSYQWMPSGCWARDTVNVRVLSTTASIVFPNNKTFYCYNDKPFLVEGFNIFKNPADTSMIIGEFSISEDIGLVDNGNNTATVYPEILQDGIFTITYSKSNGNSFEETEQFEVQYVDEIYIIGFTEHTYCSNDENVKLNGNVSEGVFYGNSVTGNPASGYYFVPSIAPAGLDTIFYSYTTPQGCTRVTSDTVHVDMSPVIEFLVDNLCAGAGTNDSTKFINNTISSDPIVLWLWNFGDASSGAENTSTLKNPKHLYTNSGSKQITLSATTDKECQSTESEIVNFGDIPLADFKWGNECFHSGIPIQFTNTSTSNEGDITSNKWKFYRDGAYSLSFDENPEITYSKYGDYDIELVAETEYGCIDTILKTLHLRRMIIVEEGYFEDFEQGVSGWFPDYINNSTFYTNSWTFGEPEGGFSGAASGINAWYTKIEATSPSEKSWVKSPCFDFSNTIRPMIKLNIWRSFDQARDGAVLQNANDNSETWNNVGTLNDGINWYNQYNIPAQPGDNNVGWSDIKDSKWTEARNDLVNLKGQTDVQFRIAYGSDGSARNNDGFAFDDIWIGENKKTVLIEHFTNTLDSKCKEADFILNNIINSSNDAIDLQYHTSFPEGDPFYLHNPSASGTREGYYGLSSIPYSMMDGGFTNAHKFDYDLKTIEKTVIDTQALKDPLFDLLLNTDNTGNSINIECSLTALSVIPEIYITLYIVVIEREITQITEENEEEIYESVVKNMLPNPSGTSFIKSWSAGENADVNYSWTFTNVFDAEEIRVVAFIQNENTREIYQSAIDKRDYISSIDNGMHISQPTKILVFPNPTSGITYIKFNQPVNEKCRLELFNNMGKLLYSAQIYKGEKLVHFSTEGLNNGLYILRIADKKRVIDIKKLIISR